MNSGSIRGRGGPTTTRSAAERCDWRDWGGGLPKGFLNLIFQHEQLLPSDAANAAACCGAWREQLGPSAAVAQALYLANMVDDQRALDSYPYWRGDEPHCPCLTVEDLLRNAETLESQLKSSYPTEEAMKAALGPVDDAFVELYTTQKVLGFGKHNLGYVPVVSPNRKRRVLLLKPIFAYQKHFASADYLKPNPRNGTLHLSEAQVGTLIIPMLSLACCEGRRYVLEILKECADLQPSTVQPYFDKIWAAMLEHKMDGLIGDADQTLDEFFGIVTTVWPIALESSRAACCKAMLANMVSNEAYINEKYPNRDDLPRGRDGADHTCHVMRRWNLCYWHCGILNRELGHMDASDIAKLASILDSMSVNDRAVSMILEVLGKARDKAAPHAAVVERFLNAEGQYGFPLMVLANIASPPDSSAPPFDRPGLIVGPDAVAKGLQLYSTDVNAIVGRSCELNPTCLKAFSPAFFITLHLKRDHDLDMNCLSAKLIKLRHCSEESGVRQILLHVVPWNLGRDDAMEDLADYSDSDNSERRYGKLYCDTYDEETERNRATYVAHGVVDIVRSFLDTTPDVSPSLERQCSKLLRRLEMAPRCRKITTQ